eukprot:8156434-Lingulodinium_polyedra.AAC.1
MPRAAEPGRVTLVAAIVVVIFVYWGWNLGRVLLYGDAAGWVFQGRQLQGAAARAPRSRSPVQFHAYLQGV